jgi:hypothetical protein
MAVDHRAGVPQCSSKQFPMVDRCPIPYGCNRSDSRRPASRPVGRGIRSGAAGVCTETRTRCAPCSWHPESASPGRSVLPGTGIGGDCPHSPPRDGRRRQHDEDAGNVETAIETRAVTDRTTSFDETGGSTTLNTFFVEGTTHVIDALEEEALPAAAAEHASASGNDVEGKPVPAEFTEIRDLIGGSLTHVDVPIMGRTGGGHRGQRQPPNRTGRTHDR